MRWLHRALVTDFLLLFYIDCLTVKNRVSASMTTY